MFIQSDQPLAASQFELGPNPAQGTVYEKGPRQLLKVDASASVGLQNPQKMSDLGTSFAAPRVAVAMAELTRLTPA